ncbi:MAG: hypothetical protein R3B82_20720 [Sandaracinaceae bacterium]
MRFDVRSLFVSITLAASLTGCGDDPVPPDAGPSLDAGFDAAMNDAGDTDAGDTDAGDTDAGDTDAGDTDAGDFDAGDTDAGDTDAGDTDAGTDAGGTDAGGTDAGTADAGWDGGGVTACVAGGGTCVPLVPTACPDGVLGDATWYSCGGATGVTCCLPTNTPPVCRFVGTRSEGWYDPDGTRICFASCAGHTASCEAIGTRSEGWYADDTSAGCMTIPVDRLIEWTMCAP